MLPAGLLLLCLDVVCCYHVVRSGRELYWMYLIIIFQPLGAIIYLVAIILPEFVSGRGRSLGRAALKVVDPARAYREAKALADESPTVYNRMAMASAAADLGHYDEAAHVYALCLDGIHADDPALLQRYAICLVELGRFREALVILRQLGDLGDAGRTSTAALLMARAHDGLGSLDDAITAYSWAAERLTGIEGLARYVDFLVRCGRLPEAQDQLAVLEKRYNRLPRAHRREASHWRDLAVKAVKSNASA